MYQSNIQEYPCCRGKVRDVYDLGNQLVIVTTDRVSAFDVVLPTIIPDKGKFLTKLTKFWLKMFPCHNHFITDDLQAMPAPFQRKEFEERTMLVRKCNPLPVECIVRGYLSGSGWKEYQKTGNICGVRLPPHLQESQHLGEPIFTPTTKSDVKDENITFDKMVEMVGSIAYAAAKQTKEIYRTAHNYAWKHGIIIADTKLEWGIWDDKLTLIDEVLTSDSSRYWPLEGYCLGKSPNSLDKQYIRDYLTKIEWDKNNPPELPTDVVKHTQDIYFQLLERLGVQC